MQVKVNELEKEIIECISYDVFFSCLDILEQLGISDNLGLKVEVSNIELDSNIIHFSLNNSNKLLEINMNFAYDNHLVNVTIYECNDITNYLYDLKNKLIISKDNIYHNNTKMLKSSLIMDHKKSGHIYEILDLSRGIDAIIKTKILLDNDHQKIISYLLNNEIDIDSIIKLINKEINIKDCHVEYTNVYENKVVKLDIINGIIKESYDKFPKENSDKEDLWKVKIKK